MAKKPKLIPITEPSRSPKTRLLAADTVGQRFLFGVGATRFAVDYSADITELKGGNLGEKPAAVVPFPARHRAGDQVATGPLPPKTD
jgi:hypothetical protein